MKHAGAQALQRLAPLIDELRALGGLREPKPGTLYRGSSAFLHFHEDAAGLFADVKLDGRSFSRFPVDSDADRQVLLEAVRAALAAGASARRRVA